MASDRDVLFANERFLIGVLQAVSGSALVAALSQAGTLTRLAGKYSFTVFLSAMAIALAAAVLAAYYKHDYKMWDLKARRSRERGASDEADDRDRKADISLNRMRLMMATAVVLIVAAIAFLVMSFWTFPS